VQNGQLQNVRGVVKMKIELLIFLAWITTWMWGFTWGLNVGLTKKVYEYFNKNRKGLNDEDKI